MSLRCYNVTDAAERLGVTERRIRQMCQGGELPGSEQREGKWRIPAGAHPRLMLTDEDVGQARALNLSRLRRGLCFAAPEIVASSVGPSRSGVA